MVKTEIHSRRRKPRGNNTASNSSAVTSNNATGNNASGSIASGSIAGGNIAGGNIGNNGNGMMTGEGDPGVGYFDALHAASPLSAPSAATVAAAVAAAANPSVSLNDASTTQQQHGAMSLPSDASKEERNSPSSQ